MAAFPHTSLKYSLPERGAQVKNIQPAEGKRRTQRRRHILTKRETTISGTIHASLPRRQSVAFYREVRNKHSISKNPF